ncbi:MAG: prolyl oligopeptidase family serine peptidase [Kiritimatiellales bacterium]|nr:prolyl oligopeptidase family serine peptidase [Kiritimatiellales bacterium]
MCKKPLIALMLVSAITSSAADYERAKTLRARMQGTVLNQKLNPVWSQDGTVLFYRMQKPNAPDKILRADTRSGKVTRAFDPAMLESGWIIQNFAVAENGDSLCLVATKSSVKTLAVAKGGVRVVDPEDSPFILVAQPYSKSLRSPNSNRRSTIYFINDTGEKTTLYWVDPEGNRRQTGTVAAGKMMTQSTYSGHIFTTGTLAFTTQDRPMVAYLGSTPEKPKQTRPTPPKREWTARFVENNLHVKNPKTGKAVQLTNDGTAEWRYCGPQHWSPDGRYLVIMREKAGTDRKLDLIEAAPEDQLQPKRRTSRYQKAGDDLFQKKPCLFDLQTLKRIPLDDSLFSNPWNIVDFHWTPQGDRLFFIYNQRGHQTLRLLAVQTATGKVRTVAEEHSDTFIDYSQKTYLHHLDATEEAVWMSERDGWNHLYLIDRKKGVVKNQITSGEWVVRGVDRIDEENRQIWFHTGGIRPDQNPYYIHYARINFDGSGLTILTEGNGTHEINYSPNRAFFTDTWSRVNQPPAHELRRAADGSLVCRLGEGDASKLLEAHPYLPEPFVAKGRDGKTDIHGVIYRPSHFDAKKKYPVIESIYAGPHGQFVPKQFETYRNQQRMAELGFIVVQIDGMGTNWRSKAFHDVCWKNLKDAGFPDRIAWMRAAARKYPAMDISRVGIYGGSAGGQNAMRALLDYNDFYKVAAADCGCHDNRMDKIWWNEAWMGWPVDESYERSSNVADAHKLQGKLLLTVGALDSNVDPSTTMQVVDSLIKADKNFDLIVFPSRGHGAVDCPYGIRRLEEFFVRHLLENAAGL